MCLLGVCQLSAVGGRLRDEFFFFTMEHLILRARQFPLASERPLIRAVDPRAESGDARVLLAGFDGRRVLGAQLPSERAESFLTEGLLRFELRSGRRFLAPSVGVQRCFHLGQLFFLRARCRRSGQAKAVFELIHVVGQSGLRLFVDRGSSRLSLPPWRVCAWRRMRRGAPVPRARVCDMRLRKQGLCGCDFLRWVVGAARNDGCGIVRPTHGDPPENAAFKQHETT